MAAEISVCYEYVDGLAVELGDIAAGMRDNSTIPHVDLRHSEIVADGLRDLNGRWDERRRNLIEGIEALADALRATSESFSAADQELADGLADGGT